MSAAKRNYDGWVLCPSKGCPGKYYYFNVLTGEAAWSLNELEPTTNQSSLEQAADWHSYPEPNTPPNGHRTHQPNNFGAAGQSNQNSALGQEMFQNFPQNNNNYQPGIAWAPSQMGPMAINRMGPMMSNQMPMTTNQMGSMVNQFGSMTTNQMGPMMSNQMGFGPMANQFVPLNQFGSMTSPFGSMTTNQMAPISSQMAPMSIQMAPMSSQMAPMSTLMAPMSSQMAPMSGQMMQMPSMSMQFPQMQMSNPTMTPMYGQCSEMQNCNPNFGTQVPTYVCQPNQSVWADNNQNNNNMFRNASPTWQQAGENRNLSQLKLTARNVAQQNARFKLQQQEHQRNVDKRTEIQSILQQQGRFVKPESQEPLTNTNRANFGPSKPLLKRSRTTSEGAVLNNEMASASKCVQNLNLGNLQRRTSTQQFMTPKTNNHMQRTMSKSSENLSGEASNSENSDPRLQQVFKGQRPPFASKLHIKMPENIALSPESPPRLIIRPKSCEPSNYENSDPRLQQVFEGPRPPFAPKLHVQGNIDPSPESPPKLIIRPKSCKPSNYENSDPSFKTIFEGPRPRFASKLHIKMPENTASSPESPPKLIIRPKSCKPSNYENSDPSLKTVFEGPRPSFASKLHIKMPGNIDPSPESPPKLIIRPKSCKPSNYENSDPSLKTVFEGPRPSFASKLHIKMPENIDPSPESPPKLIIRPKSCEPSNYENSDPSLKTVFEGPRPSFASKLHIKMPENIDPSPESPPKLIIRPKSCEPSNYENSDPSLKTVFEGPRPSFASKLQINIPENMDTSTELLSIRKETTPRLKINSVVRSKLFKNLSIIEHETQDEKLLENTQMQNVDNTKLVHKISENNVDKNQNVLDKDDLRFTLLAKRRKLDINTEKQDGVEAKKIKTYRVETKREPSKKKVTFNLEENVEEQVSEYPEFTEELAMDEPEAEPRPLPDVSLSGLKQLGAVSEGEQWYIVVDAPVLLHHYDFLGDYVKADPSCILLIPDAVRREIETLSRGDKQDRELVLLARQLTRKLATPPDYVACQDPDVEEMMADLPMAASVINCCSLMINEGYHLILLTDDTELQQNASDADIFTFTLKEIQDGAQADKPEVSFQLKKLHHDKETVNDYDKMATESQNTQLFSVNCYKKRLFDTNNIGINNKNAIENIDSKKSIVIQKNIITSTSVRTKIPPKQIESEESSDLVLGSDERREIQKNYPLKTGQFRLDKKRDSKQAQIEPTSKENYKNQINKENFQEDRFENQIENENFLENNEFVNQNYEENFQDDNEFENKIENVQDGNAFENQIENENIQDEIEFENQIAEKEISMVAAVKKIKRVNAYTIETQLKSFQLKDDMMAERMFFRLDEWMCCFTQIMEDALTRILERTFNPATHSLPPWNLRDVIQHTADVFSDIGTAVTLADKLLGVIPTTHGKGEPKEPIFPHDFLKMLGCAILFIKCLNQYLTEPDLTQAEQSLVDLLQSIEDPIVEDIAECPKSRLGSLDEEGCQEKQFFVKDPSYVIDYLRNHYAEWSDVGEVIKDFRQQNLTKVVRTCGKNIKLLTIDPNKGISMKIHDSNQNLTKKCIEKTEDSQKTKDFEESKDLGKTKDSKTKTEDSQNTKDLEETKEKGENKESGSKLLKRLAMESLGQFKEPVMKEIDIEKRESVNKKMADMITDIVGPKTITKFYDLNSVIVNKNTDIVIDNKTLETKFSKKPKLVRKLYNFRTDSMQNPPKNEKNKVLEAEHDEEPKIARTVNFRGISKQNQSNEEIKELDAKHDFEDMKTGAPSVVRNSKSIESLEKKLSKSNENSTTFLRKVTQDIEDPKNNHKTDENSKYEKTGPKRNENIEEPENDPKNDKKSVCQKTEPKKEDKVLGNDVKQPEPLDLDALDYSMMDFESENDGTSLSSSNFGKLMIVEDNDQLVDNENIQGQTNDFETQTNERGPQINENGSQVKENRPRIKENGAQRSENGNIDNFQSEINKKARSKGLSQHDRSKYVDTYSGLQIFFMELAVLFRKTYYYVECSLCELNERGTDKRREEIRTKVLDLNDIINNIIDSLGNIIVHESNQEMIRSVVQSNSEASDWRVINHEKVIRRCIRQAKIIIGQLSVVMSVIDSDDSSPSTSKTSPILPCNGRTESALE